VEYQRLQIVSGHDGFAFSVLEDSFLIAWEYLERTGELGDRAIASRFLSDTIETMIRCGQQSRLILSNRAIAAYQCFRLNGA
jgi:hypothetical protein